MRTSSLYLPLLLSLSLFTSCESMKSLSSIDGLNVSGLPSGGTVEGMDVTSGIAAAKDAYKAFALSDEEVRAMSLRFAEHSDSSNKVLGGADTHAKRLKRLTDSHTREDGLNLNFKVYDSTDVNAFSLADGTIRIHKGLMDVMSDDELLSVIGHEIGHVKLGHSKKTLQTAYATSAAKNAALSAAGDAGGIASLSTAVVGDLFDSFVNAQFSQSQEYDADEYGFLFLKKHKKNVNAAPSALFKLADLGGEHGLLSSHPDPKDRAERLIKKKTSLVEKDDEKDTVISSPGAPSDEQLARVDHANNATDVQLSPEEQSNAPEIVQHKGKIALPGAKSLKQENTQIQQESPSQTGSGGGSIPGSEIRAQNWRLRIGWYIEAGAYSDSLDAEVLAGKFKRKSSSVQVVPVNYEGRREHLVLVGPYYAKDYAARNREELFQTGSPRLVYIGK